MSHALDTTNNRNNMAFIGAEGAPWHGLGQPLTYDAPIETWKKEAGLDFEVKRAPVGFTDEDGSAHAFGSREVLYRADSKAALGIVSSGYKVVQPGEVLEFFRNLTENGGFQMDTAGSLHGGKRVWALAKMNEGFDAIGHDRVMPYLLLATSFDGGLATTAKFTAIRVVCQNTISVALNREVAGDKTVKTAHNSLFDAMLVQKRLGLIQSAWDLFIKETKQMANAELSADRLGKLTSELVAPTLGPKADGTGQDSEGVQSSKAYRAIVELFNGKAIGSDMTAGPSAWQWLNSVTQYVDHERGRNADTRMNAAWFGNGDNMKTRAMELALTV
jgi:phage/plasmid-like protein (TIGR03299 family)